MPSDQDRLAELLREVGWSTMELARRLGIRETTPRSWLAGRRGVPPAVLDWLRQVADAQAAAPRLPEGWDRSAG